MQDHMHAKQEVVHVQRLILYSVAENDKQALTPLKDQATYQQSNYYEADEITGMKKSEGD